MRLGSVAINLKIGVCRISATVEAQLGLEAQNYAAEIKLRAERKAGELLRGMDKNPGGQAEHEAYPLQAERTSPPKLSDLGISYSQSQRWQQIACPALAPRLCNICRVFR